MSQERGRTSSDKNPYRVCLFLLHFYSEKTFSSSPTQFSYDSQSRSRAVHKRNRKEGRKVGKAIAITGK